jgi:hypothetical protein
MATETFTPADAESKSQPAATTAAPLIAALETLLASGKHDVSPVAAEQLWYLRDDLMTARSASLSDALGVLLALRSDVEGFSLDGNVSDRIPPEVADMLEAYEQRWVQAIDNIAAALAQTGVAVPPAFADFFGIPETSGKH